MKFVRMWRGWNKHGTLVASSKKPADSNVDLPPFSLNGWFWPTFWPAFCRILTSKRRHAAFVAHCGSYLVFLWSQYSNVECDIYGLVLLDACFVRE